MKCSICDKDFGDHQFNYDQHMVSRGHVFLAWKARKTQKKAAGMRLVDNRTGQDIILGDATWTEAQIQACIDGYMEARAAELLELA